MPIYEYSCRKCGAHLEVMQKVTDEPLKRHGKCGGKLEKEWSQTSFQLKGSGWYVTDYAGKKADAKEGKEGKEGKESKESKEAKPESAAPKPAGGDKPRAGEKSKADEKPKSKPTAATGGGD